MTRRSRWFGCLAWCVGSSALLAGCGGGTASDETLSSDEAVSSDVARELAALPDGARLLADVQPGGDAYLRFYEMEDGDIAGIGRLDDGNGALLPGTSAEEADGLADLYRAVAGARADAAVLAKLAASDEAARAASNARAYASDRDELHERAAREPAPPALSGADQPEISTLAGCTIQSEAFYEADAQAYATNFCKMLDGLGSIHCELNVSHFDDGWHEATKYRSDSFNQTLCNTSTHLNKWRHPGHARQFVNELGPRVHSVFTWNTSRDDMEFHTESMPLSGPEASHLCASVNRRR
jgi:hypothetical protein